MFGAEEQLVIKKRARLQISICERAFEKNEGYLSTKDVRGGFGRHKKRGVWRFSNRSSGRLGWFNKRNSWRSEIKRIFGSSR